MKWCLPWVAAIFCTIGDARAAADMEVGVCTHRWHRDLPPAAVRDMIVASGAGSWRDGISWAAVERRKGVYAWPAQFEPLRRAAAESASRGLRPMVIVGYGNPLYEPGGLVTTPAARKGFADYAYWLATQLKGQVRYYEIWNEWNIGTGSTAKPRVVGDVDDYAALVKAAAAAIRRADPGAKIVAGGATNTDTAWFEAFGATGALEAVDGISIHPYDYGRPFGLNTPEVAMAWVSLVQRSLTRSRGGRPVRMYVTEIGWPAHRGGYRPEVVADYLARFMRLARNDPYVAGVWWYDLVNDGDDPDDREHRFGLFDRQFRPLPALHALKAFTERPDP